MLKFRHRLTWMDVDYARVAHHLRYAVWVDQAFHGHLFERGFRIREFMEQGYGLPYLSTACRYLRLLTLEDEVEMELSVTDVTEKGFTLRYRIAKLGDSGPAAEGEMVRRCIRQSPPKSVAMPEALRDALSDFAGTASP